MAKAEKKKREFDLRTIAVKDVRESPEALRDVNRDTEDFKLLKDSIEQAGLLKPITVRELKDPETGNKFYSLVDGLQRFSAVSELNWPEIPAHVMDLNDAEVLETQLIANVRVIMTKPFEYAKQLGRILEMNPTLTKAELAKRTGTSTSWIDQRLNLNKLLPEIGALVDSGQITVTNAIALSRLPNEEQLLNLDTAQTMSPQEFTTRMNNRVKEIREATRKGRDAAPAVFTPTPQLRKAAEVTNEYTSPGVAPIVCATMGANTPEDGFAAGVAWVLQMDPNSQSARIQKDEDRKKHAAEQKEAIKKEKDDKKAAQAARNQAEAEAANA